jgi:FAD/FMN-containing dehydrogenase
MIPPAPPFPEEYHLKRLCGIVWCYTGPMEKAEEIFKPIRTQFGKPAIDFVGPIPMPALNSMFDPLFPAGMQWYWKADFVKSVPDAAVEQHIAHARQIPTFQSGMHLYPINGAASRVAPDATAWAYRDANWGSVFVGVDPDPANNPRNIAWVRSYWESLHPYSAGGAYVNMMMHDEGPERIKASYRGNYDRLAKIKAKYDPDNVFHVNQNIKPQK